MMAPWSVQAHCGRPRSRPVGRARWLWRLCWFPARRPGCPHTRLPPCQVPKRRHVQQRRSSGFPTASSMAHLFNFRCQCSSSRCGTRSSRAEKVELSRAGGWALGNLCRVLLRCPCVECRCSKALMPTLHCWSAIRHSPRVKCPSSDILSVFDGRILRSPSR